jgi:hypothetical protein
VLELVRFAVRAAVPGGYLPPGIVSLTQLGAHVPAQCKSPPRQRPATVSGLRPHRAGSPHVVAQEPCVDTLLADPALYSARLDYPAELIRSVHLYARTQTNNQCAADSRNGGMVCPRDCVNPSSREAISPTGNRCPRLTDFGLPPTAQRRKRGCSITSFRLKLRDMDCQLRPPDTGYSATATVDPGATRRPCRGRP